MFKGFKEFTYRVIAGANVATIILMLLVGFSDMLPPEKMGVFANAGLTSPHWLMRSGGLPLGLMRSSHYALHKRSWHEPFALQFRSDSGGSLDVQVRHH